MLSTGSIFCGQIVLSPMFKSNTIINSIKIGTQTSNFAKSLSAILGIYEKAIGIKGDKNIAYLYIKPIEFADILQHITLIINILKGIIKLASFILSTLFQFNKKNIIITCIYKLDAEVREYALTT